MRSQAGSPVLQEFFVGDNANFDLDKNDNFTNVKENTDNAQADIFYQLYSIFIYDGGHYYAYMKDFESGDWIRFNDSRVHKTIRTFAKQDNLIAKSQSQRIIKAEVSAGTTTQKAGEKKTRCYDHFSTKR